MEVTVSRPDPVDLAASYLCGGIRLWHASPGDEGSRDGARRRRQVVRAAGGVARAPPGTAPGLHHLGSLAGESSTPRAESIAPRHPGRAEARRGVAARPGGLRQMRSSHDDPIQDRQEAQLSLRRVLPPGPGRAVRVHRGDDAGRPGGARSAPRAGARRAGPQPARVEGAERERKRLHDQWRQARERARQDVARAERQYRAVEPENRLVARTLEGHWEEALKKQRQVEEDYHRFLARLPATLSEADRQRIRSLSGSVAALWHAPGTTASDRKQIVRCVVERVIVVTDRATELNEVTIVWHGGVTTRHQVARPVGRYEQLKDFRRLTERIKQLHQEGLRLAQIAARLNAKGFAPPRRRGVFTAGTIGSLVRELGLVGELFRDDLAGKDEWWIPDLAGKLGVIAQKVHYWVKQGWVHSRRTPSGKHLIVWADKDEVRRLRQLAGRKNSWIAARHPELVIPKDRLDQ